MTRLTLIASLFAVPAFACDLEPDSAALLIGSHHANATAHFEETNPGVFLTWECGFVIRAGVFSNSFGDPAFALTIRGDGADLGPVNLAPFIGSAFYPHLPDNSIQSNGWIPLLGIEATLGPVFVQVMPGSEEYLDYSHLLSGGLRWEF